jgi:hypothetical protein
VVASSMKPFTRINLRTFLLSSFVLYPWKARVLSTLIHKYAVVMRRHVK